MTATSERPRPTGARGIVALVLPLASLLLGAPPVLSLSSALLEREFEWPPFLVILPFWLGLLGAPGFLKLLVVVERGETSVPFWAWASGILAGLASLGGAVAAIPVALPVPFALGAAVCCLWLVGETSPPMERSTAEGERNGDDGNVDDSESKKSD